MKISMDKKYRTRSGKSLRVLCVDRNHDFAPVVVETEDGDIFAYSIAGKIYASDTKSSLDLVEVSPYEDFKVDDPVLISADGTTWHRAHYSGYEGEYAIVFAGGKTSYSSYHNQELATRVHYPYCKKASA